MIIANKGQSYIILCLACLPGFCATWSCLVHASIKVQYLHQYLLDVPPPTFQLCLTISLQLRSPAFSWSGQCQVCEWLNTPATQESGTDDDWSETGDTFVQGWSLKNRLLGLSIFSGKNHAEQYPYSNCRLSTLLVLQGDSQWMIQWVPYFHWYPDFLIFSFHKLRQVSYNFHSWLELWCSNHENMQNT